MTDNTWLCPLCSLIRLPFGTSCVNTACENRKHLNVNGLWYAKQEQKEAKSVGIAAISDEEKQE